MKKKSPLLLLILVAIYLLLLIKTGWVSEDTYITFTPIENLVHGYGIVYNLGQRVQVYTHPLWFFLQSALYAITLRGFGIDYRSQLYVNSIGLNFLFSLLTFVLIIIVIARTNRSTVICAVALLVSKAFIDFSTSGLENPLSHLIMGLFLYNVYVKNKGKIDSPRSYFIMVLIACFGVLNRYDSVLFYFPVLFFLFIKYKHKTQLFVPGTSGLTPLLMYFLFSLLYFGFIMPNTYYAKIHHNYALGTMIKKGMQYFAASFRLDMVSLFIIVVVIVYVIYCKKIIFYPVIAGIGLYCLYILRVGGDYMSGRFISLPLFVAVFIIALSEFDQKSFYISLAGVLVMGMVLPTSPITAPIYYRENYPRDSYILDGRITDNRARFQGFLEGIMYGFPSNRFTGMQWFAQPQYPREVIVAGSAGNDRYKLGPNVYLIDKNAIIDPLLARLPVSRDECCWKPGHFTRQVPEGYVESVMWNDNRIQNKDLAAYYDILLIITQGDIFSISRMEHIFHFNTGQYNYLIDRYAETLIE